MKKIKNLVRMPISAISLCLLSHYLRKGMLLLTSKNIFSNTKRNSKKDLFDALYIFLLVINEGINKTVGFAVQ